MQFILISCPSTFGFYISRIMKFTLTSTFVVALAAQATANSWFGKPGAYCMHIVPYYITPARYTTETRSTAI